MGIYFNRHAGESQLGGLFIDVNRLKYVNDTQGHAEGDRLLQNLAEFLCRYFPRDNIYRSGGDEFVIVTPGTTEEKMRGKTREIKDAMQKESFSFAIGYAVSDHRGFSRLQFGRIRECIRINGNIIRIIPDIDEIQHHMDIGWMYCA